MEWSVRPLSDLALPEKGSIKIGPFGSQLKREELVREGIHVVGIENVLSGQFDGLGDRYITREKYRALRSVEVCPGDVLITMMGTVGEVAIVPPGTGPSIMDSHLLRFRPNLDVCLPEFVAWFLRSAMARAALSGRAHGAIMKGLNSSLVRSFPIPLPPISEQRRIVEILDQADRLRRLRAQADAKADRILPALFIKMFGDPATNPMGWPAKRFDSICDSRLGKMLDAKQQTGAHCRPYIRNANVYWDRLDLQELLEMDFDEADREEFRLRRGDILICEGGEVGRCAMWNDEIPECYFQKALHRARPFPDIAVSEFVIFLLWELAKRGALESAVSQVTFSHLTGVKLKALRIPVPPLNLQQAFAGKVRLFKQIFRRCESASQIDTLFAGLLHRSFSGSLTASWREAHMKELLREMEHQAKVLATG